MPFRRCDLIVGKNSLWNEIAVLKYFTDPVLRAPTVGSMLICLAASLMGTFAFLKKRSLMGEALSHAAYPGVVVGITLCAFLETVSFSGSLLFAIGGAFLFSLFGLWTIEWLEKSGKTPGDAALCFMLASFFAFGLLVFSYLQGAYPLFASHVQIYLYGQSATMTDFHTMIYGGLAAVIILFLVVAYRPLQAMHFDQNFSSSAGVAPPYLSSIAFVLLVLSIVIGIRGVGVILMSGMFIAPAIAARQWSDRLSVILCLAGLFGLLSGFLGNILSVDLSTNLSVFFPEKRLSLPTGPMIILVGSSFAFFSLLFSPKRGVIARIVRILQFRLRSDEENILKAIWKRGGISLSECRKTIHLWLPTLFYLLWRMQRHGWLVWSYRRYSLTPDGTRKAARIVRLHRLWEVYLTDLGWPEDQVHRTAEEMEHILTPDLENRLSKQLNFPRFDPHEQPIPERDDFR